jgi:outer membrane protein TolC
MTEVDYVYYNAVSADYDRAEYEPELSAITADKPRTVRTPDEKETWELSLEESKRIALENNKQIALLRYQPGIQGTQIEQALSEFDTTFELGGGWSRQDRQVSTNIQTFGTGRTAVQQDLFGSQVGQGGFGISSTAGASNPEGINDSLGAVPTRSGLGSIPGGNVLGLSKRNAAGGLTSIGYSLDYTKTDPVSQFVSVNPAWRSQVNLSVEQPLLQGAGVEYNRGPLLIARANYDWSIRQFDVNVRTLLRDVENAYWQLYFTYQDLYSREVGMRQALATWQKEKNKLDVGTAAKPDVAQAREQFEFFRAARTQALSRVLSAERSLRELMGLPPDDNRKIIPKDEPTIAEYEPNWDAGVLEAMDGRPELSAQRLAMRAAEIEVARQKNGLLPDLTLFGNYAISGLDNQYDQSIDRLTDNSFTDWTLAIRYRRQIGERSANAAVRRAEMSLTRERAELRNLEHTILHDLHEAYQNLVTSYDLIQIQKDRRQAAAEQLQAREEFYRQGRYTIDILLQAQTTFADALRDESQAIAQYNQALAQWQFAKGTTLTNDNVALVEEGMSLVKERFLRNRWKQWVHSLPLPIHVGEKVHADSFPEPDTTLPLYPELTPEAAPAEEKATGAPKHSTGMEGKPEKKPAVEAKPADKKSTKAGPASGSAPSELPTLPAAISRPTKSTR